MIKRKKNKKTIIIINIAYIVKAFVGDRSSSIMQIKVDRFR